MQNIVLDNIKFPTGEEKDGARFRQIQEERLNRNFRRLLEMTFEAGLGTEYKQIIESIQDDVSDMQDTITTLSGSLTSLSTTVSNLPTITHGTGTPSGGRSGDVYIKHS